MRKPGPNPKAGKAASGAAECIRLGGMTPMTTIDFPGRLAAVLFLQGCPWQCDYCHNPHLIPPRADASVQSEVDWPAALAFLQRRRGLLDGVVFSGGEPTMQAGLADAVAAVNTLGYHAALHTGGMYPQRLASLLPRLDWVGLDIKAPWDLYDTVTRRRGSGTRIANSLQALAASGIRYECRTTWHPGLFPEADLQRLAEQLRAAGVRHWALQQCRQDGRPHPDWRMPDLDALRRGFAHFEFRPA